MTRAQRIALALYGSRKPWTVQWSDEPPFIVICPKRIADYFGLPTSFAPRGCYEAMDDLDPYLDVNPTDTSVFVRGNAGMRCA